MRHASRAILCAGALFMTTGAAAAGQDAAAGDAGKAEPRIRLLKTWDDSVMVNGQYEDRGTSSSTSTTRRESHAA